MPISLSDTVRGRGDLFNSALTSYVLAQLEFQEDQADLLGTLQNMLEFLSQGQPIGQGARNMNAIFDYYLEELFGLRPPLEDIGPVRNIKDHPVDWTQLQILTMLQTSVTDEENEATGKAALNFSVNITPANFSAGMVNPGAGWGGFSPTNEGGIANIDSTGKITWSGWGGTLAAEGAQAQFASGKDAVDAFAGALGIGRGNTTTPNTPTSTQEVEEGND